MGQEQGAKLATGGAKPAGKAFECGWFYRPTVLTGVKPGMRVEQEEIFGPVLSVIRVGSFDEAIRVNNDVAYGLSSSIYTRNVNAAFRAMQDLDNGITYVNAPTIGAEAHLPFGGVKQTGNGHREGGWGSTTSTPRRRWSTWTTRGSYSAPRSTPRADRRAARSRSLKRWIFPVAVLGSSGRNTIQRGYL